MLTKEQRAVARKYTGLEDRALRRADGLMGGVMAATGLIADAIVSHGVGAIAAMGAVMGAGFYALRPSLSQLAASATTLNTAGQALQGNAAARRAVQSMESKLRLAFALATVPGNTGEDKKAFVALASEVRRDADILSPAFRIVAAGGNGFGEDRLEFIVDERFPAKGRKECVTMEQACREIGGLKP